MTTLQVINDNSSQAKTYKNVGTGNRLVSTPERGGDVRGYVFTYTNTTGGTLPDGTIIELTKIGAGQLLPTSTLSVSALGASRVLNLGWQLYTDMQGVVVDSSLAGLVSALDVSSAVNTTLQASGVAATKGSGLLLVGNTAILAQVTGGTIPANATISGVLQIVSS